MQKRDAKKGTGLDELFLKVGLYRRSEDLRELFLFIRKFPRLAPYNAFHPYPETWLPVCGGGGCLAE